MAVGTHWNRPPSSACHVPPVTARHPFLKLSRGVEAVFELVESAIPALVFCFLPAILIIIVDRSELGK